ncbi:MAG: CoA transferase [Desulfobacteraceae bacterium]|nr:CoA transferase [Desulfobacteraceae bacterium]
MNGGPLKGVRLTEFTSAWAGPYAACLLGFLGAEIIKVESRMRLDHSRKLSFSTGKQFSGPDESEVFNNINLNKKSITLNLKSPRAIDLAKKVVAVSDAVVENMRPGVMPRLGLGYDALREIKPDLIYLSSSACGQKGPEREYVGYAPTFAALGGVSYITGYEDWPPSNFMGAIDLRSATTAAASILAALVQKQRTGKGQYVDMASQESIAVLIGDVILDYVMNQRIQTRRGNKGYRIAPHNCYRCAGEDKWISIAVATNREWEGLCSAMGRLDLLEDQRFAIPEDRYKNQDELDRMISDWTMDKEGYELMECLQKAGVAAAPTLSSEGLFNDPHIRDRGVFRQVEHPVIGKDWVIAPPWRLSETPAQINRHAPLLGEHNEYVFGELLGLSAGEIERLKQEKVIY